MGSHTLQQLKRYSFDELKELFKTTMKNVNTFVPMETEYRGRASELAAGSSQATIIDSAEVKSSKRVIIVPEEGMNVESLQTKYLIIDWEVYTKESMNVTRKSSGLVHNRDPTEDKEIELWVKLKRLFESDVDDELWKFQKHVHDIT
ncbi:hypothetical protein Tco_1352634 [Tanacetum coccineum]